MSPPYKAAPAHMAAPVFKAAAVHTVYTAKHEQGSVYRKLPANYDKRGVTRSSINVDEAK